MSPCLSVALSPCLCLSVSHSQKCILKHTQNSFSPYFCTTTILSSILCDAFHKNGKVDLKPTQCQPDFKTQSNRATKTRFSRHLTKGESQIKHPGQLHKFVKIFALVISVQFSIYLSQFVSTALATEQGCLGIVLKSVII